VNVFDICSVFEKVIANLSSTYMTKKLLIVCLGAMVALTASAQDKKKVDTSKLPPASDQKGVTYAKDIKAIFEKSCVKCHGAEKPKAKLRLDSLGRSEE